MLEENQETLYEEEQEQAGEKLADWINIPTVNDLKKDMQKAQPAFDSHVSDVYAWQDNFNITGKAKLPAQVGYSNVQPQLIRKHAEWRYAAISEAFHTAPTLFDIKARSAEDEPIVEQTATLLDYQLEVLIDRVKLIDTAVRTSTDEGTVVYRTGWIHETTDKEIETLVVNGDEVIGTTTTTEKVVTKNQPIFEVVPFDRVIIDPDAKGKIQDAKFVIYKFSTNISELKKKGYKNLDKIPLTNSATKESRGVSQQSADPYNGMSSTSTSSPEINYEDKARKQLEAYEYWGYWDIDDNQKLVPIYAIFVNDVMVHLDKNPYPDQLPPFVLSQQLPLRNSNYGEPDGALLVDQQKIIGAVTRGAIDLLGRSANGQVGILEDALDPVNAKAFREGRDYTFRRGIDPNMAIFEHKFPEIPNSAFQLLEMQLNDAEALTGVKTFGAGISGASMGSVATSVRGALDASSKRESGILRRMAKGIEEVGRKIIAMNDKFLTEEEVIAITNQPYVEMPAKEHSIIMDIRLKIRTIEQDNAAAQDLAFLTQTIGNTTDPGLTKILLAKIAGLKSLPDVEERIENFEPPQDPMAEQMKQLEMAKTQSDIQLAQTRSQLQAMQAQLAAMKANTEQMDAGLKEAEIDKTRSQTDILNLEFTEEETGTNQERKLELVRAQAESNVDLEAFREGNKIDQEATKTENGNPIPNADISVDDPVAPKTS